MEKKTKKSSFGPAGFALSCLIFVLGFVFAVPARAKFVCVENFDDDGGSVAGNWNASPTTVCTADGTSWSLSIPGNSEDEKEFASAARGGDPTPRQDAPGEDWSAYEDGEHAFGMWIYSIGSGFVTVRIREEDNTGNSEEEERAVETWAFRKTISGGSQWEFVFFPLVEEGGGLEEGQPTTGFRYEGKVGQGPGDGEFIGSLGCDVDGQPDVYNPDDPTPGEPQEPDHNGVGDNDYRGVVSVSVENETSAGIYIDYLVITNPGPESDELRVERYFPDPSNNEDVNSWQVPTFVWAMISGPDPWLKSLKKSTITIVNKLDWTERINEKKHPYNLTGEDFPNNGVDAIFTSPGPEKIFAFGETYVMFITPRGGPDESDWDNVGQAQAVTFSFDQIPISPLSVDYTRERAY